MTAIRQDAPAKLNLTLHVTGRRDDGYHLLDSLVAFATIGDRVTLTPGPLALAIDGPFAEELTTSDDNLCLRAARLAGAQAAIGLTKALPVASGIGGGSADAAAVLRGLVQMGHTLPPDPAQLGADVPVCLAGRPAQMRGIGEVLDPVPPIPPLPALLVNPGVALSTPAVFAALDRRKNAPMPTPDWADTASFLAFLHACRNDLEPPAIALAPIIADVLAALRGAGAALARMSGSGATCIGLFTDPADAARAASALRRPGWWVAETALAG